MRKINLHSALKSIARSFKKAISRKKKVSTKKAPDTNKSKLLKPDKRDAKESIKQKDKIKSSKGFKEGKYNDDFNKIFSKPKKQSPKTLNPAKELELLDTIAAKAAEKEISTEKVFTDTNTLKPILKEIVKEKPELAAEADALFEDTQEAMRKASKEADAIVKRLEKEFKENPDRLEGRSGDLYTTGGDSDLNAWIYAEAVYRRFRREAKKRGLSELDFRRALDDILATEPHTLYKGTPSKNGKISRSKQLKSAREIANMAFERAEKNTGIKILDK